MDLPACPHLPQVRAAMDWRALHAFRQSDRGTAFYAACLEYAQVQWCRGLAARALLCVDRAFGADLPLRDALPWPLPYAATAWIVTHTPPAVFIGNPRVHFQHYAGRMNAPRREQRQARAWACWALVRSARPELPGDSRHAIREPSIAEIAGALEVHGRPGEAAEWHGVLVEATAGRSRAG